MFTRLACCLFAWVALPVGAVTLPAPSGPLTLQDAGNVDFLEAERALLGDLNGDRDAVAPMIGLAELYLSRGMIPESRSVIEGLPKNKLADAQRARLSVLQATLSLVDGDRDDAALLDATEGWEDAAALRAHAAQEMGRTDAARALLTPAQAALPTLPVELRSLVLPTLLDIAIAAEDWDTGAALAAAYPEIPALADQPGYWLRLGRVAERRGDPLTAFEGYLRASRGDDADAHRARIALVRLGRGTGTLGRDQQRALLDQIRPMTNAAGIETWGPLPALIARRADRHRAQLILVSHNRKHLNHRLTQICLYLDQQKQPAGVKWMIDVDPQETG